MQIDWVADSTEYIDGSRAALPTPAKLGQNAELFGFVFPYTDGTYGWSVDLYVCGDYVQSFGSDADPVATFADGEAAIRDYLAQ